MLKNRKGFMLAEILIVTLVVMIAFMVVFINYYPLVGEYKQRIVYNDMSSKYALFNMKKLYSDVSNGSKYNIREEFKDSNVKYINLLNKDNSGNVSCNAVYVVSEELEYCNQLVKQMKIEELIVSQYNITDLKKEKIDALEDYIDYLPKYQSYTNDNKVYRLIIKTNKGYSTTKLDIDLLKVDFDYLEVDEGEDEDVKLIKDFYPNELKLITFDVINPNGIDIYYKLSDVKDDLFVVESFISESGNAINPDGREKVSLAIRYNGASKVENW